MYEGMGDPGTPKAVAHHANFSGSAGSCATIAPATTALCRVYMRRCGDGVMHSDSPGRSSPDPGRIDRPYVRLAAAS